MSEFFSVRYTADSGRGSGGEVVVYVLLTSPAHMLDKQGTWCCARWPKPASRSR